MGCIHLRQRFLDEFDRMIGLWHTAIDCHMHHGLDNVLITRACRLAGLDVHYQFFILSLTGKEGQSDQAAFSG